MTSPSSPAGRDVGVGDVGQPVAAPRRQDVGVQQCGVAVVGARLDAPRSGAVQNRVTLADVASSSHLWASTFLG